MIRLVQVELVDQNVDAGEVVKTPTADLHVVPPARLGNLIVKTTILPLAPSSQITLSCPFLCCITCRFSELLFLFLLHYTFDIKEYLFFKMILLKLQSKYNFITYSVIQSFIKNLSWFFFMGYWNNTAIIRIIYIIIQVKKMRAMLQVSVTDRNTGMREEVGYRDGLTSVKLF